MYQNFAKATIKFCESNLPSYIAQPANAWSILVYIFIGIYLFFISRNQQNLLLKFLWPIVILIGLFSFIFHASNTFVGQFLDLGSNLLLSSYLLVFNLHRLNAQFFTRRRLFFAFFILIISSLMVVYFIKAINNFNIGILLFAFQILVVLILERQLHQRNAYSYNIHNLLIAFIIFMAAITVWILDFSRIWCDPNTFHLINGHALWHILNGFALVFLYFFYKQFD